MWSSLRAFRVNNCFVRVASSWYKIWRLSNTTITYKCDLKSTMLEVTQNIDARTDFTASKKEITKIV